MRPVRLLAVAGALAALLLPAAAPAADEFLPFGPCLLPTDVHCVSDVTVDAAAAPAGLTVQGDFARPDAASPFSWARFDVVIAARTSCPEFAADQQFNCIANLVGIGRVGFTLRLGEVEPNRIALTGTDVSVTPSRDAAGHRVRIEARPAAMAWRSAGCRPGACGSDLVPADLGFEGRLSGAVFSNDDWDAVERDRWRGLWETYTVQSHGFEVDPSRGVLVVRLANPHLDRNGRPFLGSYEAFLPTHVLRNVFGVPDPLLVRGDGIEVIRTDGSRTSPLRAAVVGSPAGVVVRLTGIPFSAPRLRIVATSAPGKPRRLRGSRPTPDTAILRFREPALDGGSAITRYLASCVAGTSVVRANGVGSPLRLSGLRPSASYRCSVRARNALGRGLEPEAIVLGAP